MTERAGGESPSGEAVPAYEALTPFFPRRSDLARALGVTPDTVAGWDDGASPEGDLEQIALLGGICAEIRPHMTHDAAVGEWLLAPHPGLDGRSPAAALQAPDSTAIYDQIINLTGHAAAIIAAREAWLASLSHPPRPPA